MRKCSLCLPFAAGNIQGDCQNSWNILNAILDHKYQQNHWNRIISREWHQPLQQKLTLIQSVWVSPQYKIDCFANVSTQEACMITPAETRSRSNVWKEHIIRTLKDTNMIKLTFCCKLWVYLLCVTPFGWFWWYNLWPKMAFKMSQEFLTASLDTIIQQQTVQKIYSKVLKAQELCESWGAWLSWAPIPNKPLVSVDVKQHSTKYLAMVILSLLSWWGV